MVARNKGHTDRNTPETPGAVREKERKMQRARVRKKNHEQELRDLCIAELEVRKEELKQLLIQFDRMFARKHKRMPLKDEKEPIRPLYDHYNDLKANIKAMELEKKNPQIRELNVSLCIPTHIDISRRGRQPSTSESSRPRNTGREEAPSSSQVARIPDGASSQDLLQALIRIEKHKWLQAVSRVKDLFKEHNHQEEQSQEEKSPRELVKPSLEFLDDATWGVSVLADELMETLSKGCYFDESYVGELINDPYAKEDLLDTFAKVIEIPRYRTRETPHRRTHETPRQHTREKKKKRGGDVVEKKKKKRDDLPVVRKKTNKGVRKQHRVRWKLP